MRRLIIVLVMFIALPALAGAPRLTTVILARHAEKADTSADTELSAIGHARANELARVLAGTNVAAVYTTQFARTRQTGAPLAAALKLTPVAVEATKSYAKDLADRIRRDHVGQTVVVVGHSNTTIDVMKELGVPNPPLIPEPQFDDLFVVTFIEGAAPSVVALRYGAVAR
jgi:broad specificity phosphatase PhoE